MLTKSPYDESTLLSASRILQEAIDKPLLDLAASRALAIGDLHKTLENTFYSQRLGLPQSEALFLLGFECYVASVAVFVIDGLERSAI